MTFLQALIILRQERIYFLIITSLALCLDPLGGAYPRTLLVNKYNEILKSFKIFLFSEVVVRYMVQIWT